MGKPASVGAVEQWAADPERIDPDDFPARKPFVKLMTWAPCPGCHLRVHAPYTRFLIQGLHCPGCGTCLLPPPVDALERLSIALRREDELSEQID